MSRTYRKHKESFESYYFDWLNGNRFNRLGYFHDDEWYEDYLAKERYRYKTDNGGKWYDRQLPRWYRNQVNRKRRAKDKRELFKAVNWIDYDEQCSDWNCKDNDHWGYW